MKMGRLINKGKAAVITIWAMSLITTNAQPKMWQVAMIGILLYEAILLTLNTWQRETREKEGKAQEHRGRQRRHEKAGEGEALLAEEGGKMNQNQKMKSITMGEAILMAGNPEAEVYMMVRVYGDTTVDELGFAEGFFVPEKEEPKKEEKTRGGIMKAADHGRIVALYTANPPRSIKWIADDMGITQQTVINHLKKDGLYDPGKKEES